MKNKILILENDIEMRNLIRDAVQEFGHEPFFSEDFQTALADLKLKKYDLFIINLNLEEIHELEAIQFLKKLSLAIPIIFLTDKPSMKVAQEAISLGVFRYIIKPISIENFKKIILKAMTTKILDVLEFERDNFLKNKRRKAINKKNLQRRFEKALESIWIAFQPIIDAKNNTIFGYEALMRTNEKSLHHPHKLLSAAEKLKKNFDLSQIVQRKIMEEIRQNQNMHDLHFFINVQIDDLCNKNFLYSNPLKSKSNKIVLEIIERNSIFDMTKIQKEVDKFRKKGFLIAIDDLGSGFSSLDRYIKLQPNFVKLDKSLIIGISKSPTRQDLVQTLIAFFNRSNVLVVAEGIETIEDFKMIKNFGCDFLQGYLIGKPQPYFIEEKTVRFLKLAS